MYTLCLFSLLLVWGFLLTCALFGDPSGAETGIFRENKKSYYFISDAKIREQNMA